MKMKTLRRVLIIIGMLILSCIPSMISGASSNTASLTSPIEEVATLFSKAAYGGSVRKSFASVRSLSATRYPTSIVNSNFDYPYYSGSGLWMRGCNDGPGCLINDIDPNNGLVWLPDIWNAGVSGFDFSKFGWKSTQTGKIVYDGAAASENRKNAVELQKDYYTGNMYAEIIPYEHDAAIYQDISTTPNAVYHWSLQHASQSVIQNGDCTQITIGGSAVNARRTVTNAARQPLGDVGTNVCTTVTNPSINGRSITSRNHNGQWDTYEGDYLVPPSQTVTRFSFRSLVKWNSQGNIVDNIRFEINYPLTYHINGGVCTDGGSSCMPVTGKVGNFYHNYYRGGTNVSLAGNGGSQDQSWQSSSIKRDGYVFGGWGSSASSTNAINNYTINAPSGDVYAIWIPLSHISWEKIDKVTGQHIGGATFTLTTRETGASVTVVDNGANDSDPRAGYITYNKGVNKYLHYTIKETIPPSGYFNDSENATLYTDSNNVSAVIKDTPKITPTIRKYVGLKDDGYSLTLNFTGKQIIGSGGTVSMTNTVVKDTLTKWVNPTELDSKGTGATISAVDASGKAAVAPKGTSISYDSNSKTLTWQLGDFVPLNGVTYSISFKIKSTPALSSDATARQSLSDATKYGPDKGEDTTGDISAGKQGWFTNTQATLTYDAKYSTGKQSNNKWDMTNVSGVSTTKNTNSSVLPNGTYSINAAADSSYGFDVPGFDVCSSNSTCNVNIAQGTSSFGSTASLDQFWTFTNHGDYYTIMNGMGGCLTAQGNSMSNGTSILQSTCNNSAEQKWHVVDSGHDGEYMLVPNSNSLYAVSIYNGQPSKDAPVKLKPADSNDESQRFLLSPVKSSMNIDASKTYDILSNADGQFGFDSPGFDVCTGQCSVSIANSDYPQEKNGANQGYRFVPQSNGGYVLKNGMGTCLDVNGAVFADGSQIQQYPCNGSIAQVWSVIDSDNSGSYLIVPFYNRSFAISIYSGNATINQTLKLKRTDTSLVTEQWILSPRNNNTVSMSTPYVIKMAMNPVKVADVPGLDNCTGSDCNIATAGNDYLRGSNGYDQTWKFTQNSDGSYTITNLMNQCLDVYGASFTDGARIDAYACNGTLAQHWVIRYLSHSFMLVPKGNTNYAMSIYSGSYTGGQYMKLKKFDTGYLSERFTVSPLSDLNTNVKINNSSDNSYNIGTSRDNTIKMSSAKDDTTSVRILNWLGSNGNSIYMLEMASSMRCIKVSSNNQGASISTGTCSTSDSSMAWQSVYYNGHWMFRNMASGYFMEASNGPVINGTTLVADGLVGQQLYRNSGMLIYKKPVIIGYRWWYNDSKGTASITLYDAGSDNKDQSQKIFSCAAYINESFQGTDGYTKSIAGSTKTTETDIAKLKNDSLRGKDFNTWSDLSHSINSPETQAKYNKIVAELQSACDSSNGQATAASTSDSTPILSSDMQKAYSQGGALLITRSKQNTTVSAPSKSMAYYVRPVDYLYEHYTRQLSIDSPGNGWHLEGDFSCSTGYDETNQYASNGTIVNEPADSKNLYCKKVVVGDWQQNDDTTSIKASYNKQGQSFKGSGASPYVWSNGTRAFRGYYCATSGTWSNGQTDANSYLNGCGTNASQLAPSYDLNRTNIHLYHYMMINILCDKTDFTNYYNKVKDYVFKNDSTAQGSGLSSKWQGSLISKPSSNANVVQFPQATALLTGVVKQNTDGTTTNVGTTGITASTLANNLKAIGVDSSSNDSNATLMNNYLSSYTASKDPVYTKECPFSCAADGTISGTSSISTTAQDYNSGKTGFYNRASDGKGAIIGDMSAADAFSSVFYRNNAWNQVALSVLRPVSGNGLTYNNTGAKTTTVLKTTTGTPWNTSLGLSNIQPNSLSTSMFYSNDTIGTFMGPTSQSIYEAPNNGTLNGEQNIFKIRSAWASSPNNPLKFDVSWEFNAQNGVNVPTMAGFGANGTLTATNIKENIVNATSDGRCWYISKVSGYPSDTTSIAHDYSGYGSNVFSNADNPIFSGFKSGFNVTFIRSSSE